MKNRVRANSGPPRRASRDRRRESGPGPASPARPAAATKDSRVDPHRAAPLPECTAAETCQADHIGNPRPWFLLHSAPTQPIHRSTRPPAVGSLQDCPPLVPPAKSGKLKAAGRAAEAKRPNDLFPQKEAARLAG